MISKGIFSRGFIVLSIACLLGGCSSSRYMYTIVGGEYDEKKDVTDYFVLPLGQVALPGKWKKTSYNQTSRQQFFKNQDSISVAIAFGLVNKFEFNGDGSLKGFDFVEAFYKWDADYFESQGIKSQILESDKTKNYMIYRLYGKYNDENIDNYYIVRAKDNGSYSSYGLNNADKWTENEKIKFLKNLLLSSAE